MQSIDDALAWLREQGAFALAPHPQAPGGLYVARYLVEAGTGTTLLDRGMLVFPDAGDWVIDRDGEGTATADQLLRCQNLEQAVRTAWDLLAQRS